MPERGSKAKQTISFFERVKPYRIKINRYCCKITGVLITLTAKFLKMDAIATNKSKRRLDCHIGSESETTARLARNGAGELPINWPHFVDDGTRFNEIILGHNTRSRNTTALILWLPERRVNFLELAAKYKIVLKGLCNFATDVNSICPVTAHIHFLFKSKRKIDKNKSITCRQRMSGLA